MVTRPCGMETFYEYPTNHAVVNKDEELDKSLQNYVKDRFVIPNYQRKIVWKKKEIMEFIQSEAQLFGISTFAHIHDDKPLILLDGLQRFATATALLKILYQKVLAPKPDIMGRSDLYNILKIKVQNMEPIITSNHNELWKYKRVGIQHSYRDLYAEMTKLVEENIDKDELDLTDVKKRTKAVRFAEDVRDTFMHKQIAFDIYYGFKSENEFIQTFIHMNSTGIMLTDVDLLRSEIIDQAQNRDWVEDDIDELENTFTDVFGNSKYKGVEVLGKQLYDAIKKENEPKKVFNEWDDLKTEHTDKLFEFIRSFYQAIEGAKKDKDATQLSKYLFEIANCGKLPTAITLWYLYKYTNLRIKESEFEDSEEINKDLRVLLRAFYRRLLDGTVGQLNPQFLDLIVERENEDNNENYTANYTAEKLAGKIVEQLNIVGELDKQPPEMWLKSKLNEVEVTGAKRVFNMCLLPDRKESTQKFDPLIFSRGKNYWQIDHLIPKKGHKIPPGFEGIMNTLRNLAPLPSAANLALKNDECRVKLGNKNNHYHSVQKYHAYIGWLVTQHNDSYKDESEEDHPFNNPVCLGIKSEQPVGDDRIDKIYDLIKDKI